MGIFGIISLILHIKTYKVTQHLNRLEETVQMRGHKIWFQWEITKIIL